MGSQSQIGEDILAQRERPNTVLGPLGAFLEEVALEDHLAAEHVQMGAKEELQRGDSWNQDRDAQNHSFQ